jgi:hypothetical protein
VRNHPGNTPQKQALNCINKRPGLCACKIDLENVLHLLTNVDQFVYILVSTEDVRKKRAGSSSFGGRFSQGLEPYDIGGTREGDFRRFPPY